MRIHHEDGNRLEASEYYFDSLEDSPEDIEALNCFGLLLDDVCAVARRQRALMARDVLLAASAERRPARPAPPGGGGRQNPVSPERPCLACEEEVAIFTAALRCAPRAAHCGHSNALPW